MSRLKFEWVAAVLALQFLTRLPLGNNVPFTSAAFAASVRYYPLVGMIIGALIALAFVASSTLFPNSVAVILSTLAGLLLTGAFHEDGLADMFDGIGGGQNAAQSLTIMKDSRIGVFGAVALLSALMLKIATLSEMPTTIVIVTLVAAHCLSRWSSVIVIATSRYVRDEGKSKPVAGEISKFGVLLASMVALVTLATLGFLTDTQIALGAIFGMACGHAISRWIYERKIGGFTGDCLGATQQFSEIGAYLGVLACL